MGRVEGKVVVTAEVDLDIVAAQTGEMLADHRRRFFAPAG
jgi:hypothetical protein